MSTNELIDYYEKEIEANSLALEEVNSQMKEIEWDRYVPSPEEDRALRMARNVLTHRIEMDKFHLSEMRLQEVYHQMLLRGETNE